MGRVGPPFFRPFLSIDSIYLCRGEIPAMNGVIRPPRPRTRRREKSTEDSLLQQLTTKVIGQDHAMRTIVPWVRMYEAGLGPEGRPAGVFLLLGPTGTGKTKTV